MIGDEAFYYQHQDGKLQGAILTHIDDFTAAGTEDFMERILDGVSNQMTVSKVERHKYRYTSLDIEILNKYIEVSM